MNGTAISKTCTSCNTAKPTEMFSKHRKAKDGLQQYCKSCQSSQQRARKESGEFDSRLAERQKAHVKKEKKICSICKDLLSVDAFGRSKYNVDRLQYNCKPCQSQITRTKRLSEDYVARQSARQKATRQTKEYQDAYAIYRQTDAYKASQKKYRESDLGKKTLTAKAERYAKTEAGKEYRRLAVSRYAKSNPEVIKAHNAVGSAIRSGKLVRMPCEVCGNPKSEGHHDDYSKRLDVRWLCKKHHIEHHMGVVA